MNRTCKWKILAAMAALLTLAVCGPARRAAAQDQQPGAKTDDYTPAEYNTYRGCEKEKTSQLRIKCLDNFVQQYPNSTLLRFAYADYYNAYAEVKNYSKVIEYTDKLLAFGVKIEIGDQYLALYARTFAYNNLNSSDKGQSVKAIEAVRKGLKVLGELKKPDNVDGKTWDEQRKQVAIFFNGAGGAAALAGKDYPSAIEFSKAVLTLSSDEPKATYHLGLAYLELNPPQYMDAFWAIARALTSKSMAAEDSKPVKRYLRKKLADYQSPACDNLIDPQLNELLALAAGSPTRPDTYKIPSAADLVAARNGMTIVSVLTDLKAGGDKAKITWLAACGGLEFPETPGKVIEVTPTDTGADLKLFLGATDDEINAATTANMEVKVEGQPNVKRIEKDNLIHFTGTLASYDPDPFLVHWGEVKVNPADIPAEKKQPAKKPPVHHRAPSKRPS